MTSVDYLRSLEKPILDIATWDNLKYALNIATDITLNHLPKLLATRNHAIAIAAPLVLALGAYIAARTAEGKYKTIEWCFDQIKIVCITISTLMALRSFSYAVATGIDTNDLHLPKCFSKRF